MMTAFPRSMLLLCTGVLLLSAAESPAGRWEGIIHCPSRKRRWCSTSTKAETATGSGRDAAGSGIQGAPLMNLSVSGDQFSCTVKDALGGARFKGRVSADGTAGGTFEMGGNSAALTLRKTGTASVELPRHSTMIRHELEGDWEGDITVLDHPVQAKLSLANHENGEATAKLVIKGRQENVVPVERVTQDADLLTLDVPSQHATYDGRINADDTEIDGVFEQQSVDFPIVFRRAGQSRRRSDESDGGRFCAGVDVRRASDVSRRSCSFGCLCGRGPPTVPSGEVEIRNG